MVFVTRHVLMEVLTVSRSVLSEAKYMQVLRGRYAMPIEYYLLIAGVILMSVELAVPGFGIFGIGGLICLTGGGYFLLGGGFPALTVLLGFYLVAALVLAFLCLYLPKESKWNPFVLWDKQQNSAGYTGGSDYSSLLGKQGLALTTLRPSGTALIEGKRYDVSSLGDFLPKDSKIVVAKVEGNKLFVDLVKE